MNVLVTDAGGQSLLNKMRCLVYRIIVQGFTSIGISVAVIERWLLYRDGNV